MAIEKSNCKNCMYATDTATSFGDYVSTFCRHRMENVKFANQKGEVVFDETTAAESCVMFVEKVAFSEKSVILHDNWKIKRKIILKESKKYLYFDNKFWKECNEPRYLVLTFGLGHNHGGTGFFIEWFYNPNISNTNYFTALQRNEAIEYGKKVAISRGDTESVDRIGKHDNIEVLMPEMVKLCPAKDHGKGDDFHNTLEAVTENASNVAEAGFLAMAVTLANLKG